jgi:S-methylmethionine-dependent homocysteine/selenocysteine methylase
MAMDVDPSSITLLDGATGTELHRRDVDVSLPLWSARAIFDAPDTLAAIHRDYLLAGADAITTNTFRTHRRSLAKGGLGNHAWDLTARAVDIARKVRDEIKPDAAVYGCVGPLEDCYRPDLVPSEQECHDEHGEMIQHLLDAGVDGVLLETMNSQREATAAIDQARRLLPGRWMISFCVKTEGPPGFMLRGTAVADMIPEVRDAAAVGINCIVASAMEKEVMLLRRLLGDRPRIMAYANTAHYTIEGSCGGGADFTDSDVVDPVRYAQYALQWVHAGASIIGGCCGTSPETIHAVADALGKPTDLPRTTNPRLS